MTSEHGWCSCPSGSSFKLRILTTRVRTNRPPAFSGHALLEWVFALDSSNGFWLYYCWFRFYVFPFRSRSFLKRCFILVIVSRLMNAIFFSFTVMLNPFRRPISKYVMESSSDNLGVSSILTVRRNGWYGEWLACLVLSTRTKMFRKRLWVEFRILLNNEHLGACSAT